VTCRPVVLWWRKRIWRCRESTCGVRTWTERVTGIAPRAVLTERARAEACRQVGKDAHAVAAVARDLGVGWATVMRAVGDHGRPPVEDPDRLDGVAALGLDETSFLKATRRAPTRYVTGLVDLEGGRLLDVVADRTRPAVDGWLDARSRDWLARIGTVALDPWRGYASALVVPLGHATVVVDHFHAIRLANLVVDQVRRRTQQATLGHRGRKRDPLYRIRKLLLVAAEQLTERGRCGCGPGLPPVTLVVRWWPPGRARSCCEPSTPPTTWPAPAPPWSASTAGQTASGPGAVQACPHRPSLGRRDSCLACHQRLLQRAHRGYEPAHQEGETRRAWLPQLPQLPAAAAAALRGGMADSPDRETTRPRPHLVT
jgi:hypothetical protein